MSFAAFEDDFPFFLGGYGPEYSSPESSAGDEALQSEEEESKSEEAESSDALQQQTEAARRESAEHGGPPPSEEYPLGNSSSDDTDVFIPVIPSVDPTDLGQEGLEMPMGALDVPGNNLGFVGHASEALSGGVNAIPFSKRSEKEKAEVHGDEAWIGSFPAEILDAIFQYLDFSDLENVALTDRNFYHASQYQRERKALDLELQRIKALAGAAQASKRMQALGKIEWLLRQTPREASLERLIDILLVFEASIPFTSMRSGNVEVLGTLVEIIKTFLADEEISLEQRTQLLDLTEKLVDYKNLNVRFAAIRVLADNAPSPQERAELLAQIRNFLNHESVKARVAAIWNLIENNPTQEDRNLILVTLENLVLTNNETLLAYEQVILIFKYILLREDISQDYEQQLRQCLRSIPSRSYSPQVKDLANSALSLTSKREEASLTERISNLEEIVRNLKTPIDTCGILQATAAQQIGAILVDVNTLPEERGFIWAYLENLANSEDSVDRNAMITIIPHILGNLNISLEDSKRLLTMFTALMNSDEIYEWSVINAMIHILESEDVPLRVKEHLFTRLFSFSDDDEVIKATLTLIKCTLPVLSHERISKEIRARMFKLLEFLIWDDSEDVRNAATHAKNLINQQIERNLFPKF